MAKTRSPYTAVVRQLVVDSVRCGRTPEDLAREFEPSAQAIRAFGCTCGSRPSGTDRRPAHGGT